MFSGIGLEGFSRTAAVLLQKRKVGGILSGLVLVSVRRLFRPSKLDSKADRGNEKLTGHAAYLVSIKTLGYDSEPT